jgi:FkbM family methyltransferase
LFDFSEKFARTGDVVWDVGANVGMFTFACAFRAGSSGHVVAIEPDAFLVDLL